MGAEGTGEQPDLREGLDGGLVGLFGADIVEKNGGCLDCTTMRRISAEWGKTGDLAYHRDTCASLAATRTRREAELDVETTPQSEFKRPTLPRSAVRT